MKVSKPASSLRIPILYIVLGIAWVYTTDLLSTWLLPINPGLYLRLQTVKGWLFVLVSALFFYIMLRAEERQRQDFQHTLEESEQRYRTLFTDSPTPLWEEDFSAVKVYLDQLRAQGIEDFATYFAEHPDVVQQAVRSVKVVDVNAAACKLYEASREELLTGLQNLLGKAPKTSSFGRELTMIAQGHRQFDIEVTVTTLRGGERHTIVHWVAAPGFEQTLQRVYVNVTDITERKLVEEHLRQSNEKLQTLIQASPLAIYTVDRNGYLQLWNPAAEQIFGWTAEEVLGRPMPDLPPEQHARFYKQLDEIFSGRTVLNTELERPRKDGSTVMISLTSAPMRLANGGIDQMLNVAADITERKRLENERNVLLEQLNLILEHSPIACIMCDRNYLISYWNPAAEQIFGFKEAEVLGRSPFTLFIPPDAQNYVRAILERLAHDPATMQGVNANVTRDGRRITCEWSNTPLMDDQGNFNGLLAMAQDVTERVQVMEVLQESEQRFRRLVDSNIIGVAIYEADGAVIEANEAFFHMTGYEHSDLPLDWYALIPPEQSIIEEQMLREINSLGAAQAVEREIRRKDGGQIPVLVGATRLDDPTQVITFVLDLSETKQKEAQIRASLAEKEILLREVHHRVKNNLEVIISLAELQTIKISDPVTLTSIRELQERVRSIALVHENLYRSENLEQIHIQTYLEKLIGFLIASFAAVEYDIRVDAGDVVMDIAHAIPCGLIVNELVTNALKHAFPPQRQQMSVPQEQQITIRLSEDKQQYILEVWDNGVGLPADLDLQNAKSLGLRLVNLLSLQLHGQVQAETDTGTRFRITFPGHS